MFMISDIRFLPTESEVLTITLEPDLFLYVDALTYGRATSLQYEHNSPVTFQPKFSVTSSPEKSKAVDKFLASMPEPLNMLAPFLLLVERLSEAECEDLTHLCGLMHKITKQIELVKYVHLPKEVRSSVLIFDNKDYLKEWTLSRRGWLTYNYVDDIISRYNEEVNNREIPHLPTWDEVRKAQEDAIPQLLERAKVEMLLDSQEIGVNKDQVLMNFIDKVMASMLEIPKLMFNQPQAQPAPSFSPYPYPPLGQAPGYPPMGQPPYPAPGYPPIGQALMEEPSSSSSPQPSSSSEPSSSSSSLRAEQIDEDTLMVFEDDDEDDDDDFEAILAGIKKKKEEEGKTESAPPPAPAKPEPKPTPPPPPEPEVNADPMAAIMDLVSIV